MKFIHRFSKTVSCIFEIADKPPEPGVMPDREICWQGRPKRKHLQEYLRWMHECNRSISDLFDMKLMLCFRVEKSVWQFWVYVPGEAPKMEKTGSEPEQPYCEANHIGAFINDDSLDE